MNTKDKICLAVQKIMFAEGQAKLTMSNVADRAGIGKSTLYEYFDSKEDMMAHTIVYISNQYVDQFYNFIWEGKDLGFKEVLRRSIDRVLHMFHSEMGQFVRMIEENDDKQFKFHKKMKNELKTLHKKTFKYTKKLVFKGIEDGVLRPDLSDIDILMFQRMMIMVGATLANQTEFIDESEKIENEVDYMMQLMLKTFGK